MTEKSLHKCTRIIFLLLLTFVSTFILVSSVGETSIPEHTKNFYVNDFGNIFTESQVNEMMDRAVKLAYKENGIQVVVTTIESLNGSTIEDYANLMYNKYGIGKDDKGILILLSKKERKIRVEVGYNLESYMTDSKAGKMIQDYAISFLKNNQFDLGLMSLQKAMVEDLDKKFEAPKATAAPTKEVTKQIEEAPKEEPVTRSNVQTENNSNNTSTTAAINESSSMEGNDSRMNTFLLVGIIAAIAFGAVFAIETITIRKLKKEHKEECDDYEEEIRDSNRENEKLESEISKLRSSLETQKNSYDSLKRKFEKLTDRFNRATKLHDGLDSEIDQMIQKEIDEKNRSIAAQFDKHFAVLATEEPLMKYKSKGPKGFDAFDDEYRSAFTAYESLSDAQLHYVKTDISMIKKFYDEGLLQKSKDDAAAYNESLKSCTKSCSGTESNLSTFERLNSQYKNMDSRTQSFVDASLIHSLSVLMGQAERQRRARIEREEEERRRREEEEARRRREREEEEERRRQQDSWSSSFDSGGFGGFGGSSGGGSASADF